MLELPQETLAKVLLGCLGSTSMSQEVSVSYQAVKSKVYKLIDALVEGEKDEAEVQDSMRRWWNLIHPADRPIAQKYLLMVLERSHASLGAISDGLFTCKEFAAVSEPKSDKRLKLQQTVKQAMVSNIV